MNSNQKKVFDYYNKLESKIGYRTVLGGSKHFGYYPSGKADISEKQAQSLMQDKVGEFLNLKKGQKVLDAGCGEGVVSCYLADKYNVKVTGITIVPFEVKKAQKRAKKLGVSNLNEYIQMDYSKTTFKSNSFDAIYTTETLSHSPDIQKTSNELYRLLKPGGKFAFFEYQVADFGKFTEFELEQYNLVRDGSAMFGLDDFEEHNFTRTLKKVGFKDVKEKDYSKNFAPSFYRLHKLAQPAYKIVKSLNLERKFINTTAAALYYPLAKKNLLRYVVYYGSKPANDS